MAGTKEIKQRIRSVKNTKKITKAMELVAASKMKRSVSRALSSRLYAGYSWDLLVSLSGRLEEITHPFFIENNKDKDLLILITSNGGLCGAYNSQVIKKTLLMIKERSGNNLDIITIGKKGDNAMRRIGQNVIASFIDLPDNSNLSDINPVSKLIIDEYKKENYKNIYIAYTDFVSALTQKAQIKKLLPISKTEIKEFIDSVGENKDKQKNLEDKKEIIPYLFEGDTGKLIESLAEKLTKMQIYQMILESSASEQSSRMMAMKNASEAAGEMIGGLTLMFNKARQAGITQEISEISAGMTSIE
ncbi:TPA: ATP synthase F1 subunit gamma [Candidatus Nomurabacteria bacterium]|nr:MAG: ATP synthase F0F1 subunit gamma [Parcubacteria bacterium RAAC4_OD1_1]HCY26623.1 ATP synthase F1 subunit gamma [Candidatus Nomurabacteria bacterium]